MLSLCSCDDAKDAKVTAMQGEGQAEEDRRLYERLPPLPKLGKSFDDYLSQYRRDDAEEEEEPEWSEGTYINTSSWRLEEKM